MSFEISDPRQRIVFARPINPAFAVAEVIWILAGSNNASFLRSWNPRIGNFSDDGITMHGAYGHRLGRRPLLDEEASSPLHRSSRSGAMQDQLKMAHDALKHTPYSRQVVLQIWDSNRDMPNPGPRSRDVPCNVLSHLMIREGNLHWLQVMRSNDLMWGLPYNLVQFTTIQEVMAGWLGVEVGPYFQVSDSLHVYKRHWPDLERGLTTQTVAPTNVADLRIQPYKDWEIVFRKVVSAAHSLTRAQSDNELTSILQTSSGIPGGYREWLALLTAEALRRRGYASDAREIIQEAGSFWSASWNQWAKVARLPPGGDELSNRRERQIRAQQNVS